jgi:hypothetical protein
MARTKKTKTPKSKAPKSKTPKSKTPKPTNSKKTPNSYQTIINIINSLSNSKRNHTFDKSRNNLPAQLMIIDNQTKKVSLRSSKPQVFNRTLKSSSSFSSITQNGETHSEGKNIINNSLNPFIEIKEMKNGDVQHYMIPKNTLLYKNSNSTKRKTQTLKSKAKSKSKSKAKAKSKSKTKTKTKSKSKSK